MWRRAAPLVFELQITLPDVFAVLRIAAPDLAAVHAAAISTDDFPRKACISAMLAPALFAALYLMLHHVEHFLGDDGGVAVLDIIAGNLALVALHLLIEEVHREGLLQSGVALVLLVRQDRFDRRVLPCSLSRRGRYSLCGHMPRPFESGWRRRIEKESSPSARISKIRSMKSSSRCTMAIVVLLSMPSIMSNC